MKMKKTKIAITVCHKEDQDDEIILDKVRSFVRSFNPKNMFLWSVNIKEQE